MCKEKNSLKMKANLFSFRHQFLNDLLDRKLLGYYRSSILKLHPQFTSYFLYAINNPSVYTNFLYPASIYVISFYAVFFLLLHY